MKFTLIPFLLFGYLSGWGQGIKKTEIHSPIIPNKIEEVYSPSQAKNLEGFLGYRLKVNLEKRLLKIDSAILLSGFRNRPGSQVWIGEHVGKFLFSAANTYIYSGDERIQHLMTDMANKYMDCQLADGYLGTYLPKDYWTDWDVWAHKYGIIGLLSYFQVSGDERALKTSQNMADLLCRTFGDKPGLRDLMQAGYHAGMAPGSVLEPMVDLYRFTGEKRYLDFCEYILRAFEQDNGPKIISKLLKGESVTQVGDAKAYEMMSCFLGILKYYKLTGEQKYYTAMQKAWEDIKEHHIYITGTASVDEVFIKNDLFPSENENKMGEGCVTVTWIQFNLALFKLTGEAKYLEEIEKSDYNHLLAAENPKTGCVSYYTALQGVRPYKCDQGFSCCLSSVPRGISLIPQEIAGTINGKFTLLLYEKGEIEDSILTDNQTKIKLKIQVDTKFPLEGKVEYTIHPEKSKVFEIQFRIPYWAEGFRASINGKPYPGEIGKYLSIKRSWKEGDIVKIEFEMPMKTLDGGISYPNKIAFKKGPQILALDSYINPNLSVPITNLYYSLPSKNQSIIQIPTQEKAVNGSIQNWEWKQSYSVPMISKRKNIKKDVKLELVPFSESGQTGSDMIVWINKN